MTDKLKNEEQVKAGVLQSARSWGESPAPPTVLATLIAAQHLRPFQALPMVFPPLLLFSSYLNLSGYTTDAGGITAAWSGIYLLLAQRRKQAFQSKFSARGITRGITLGVCAANLIGGSVAYALGQRKNEVV